MGEGWGEGELLHKNIEFAKALRTNQTEVEIKVWQALRAGRLMNYKFKRQVPLADFIVDFVCFKQKLIIEIDGGQHMDNKMYDTKRTDWLMKNGFQVLRFWNHDVFQQTTSVLEVIMSALL